MAGLGRLQGKQARIGELENGDMAKQGVGSSGW